ncbi:recombinase family protein, partial [Acetivibrio ethanolgignens]|uniref:recombinase family protein n=1 Tax=Acetivibrio ethanolgignens TaxID=290052 RepID=UPI00155F36E5
MTRPEFDKLLEELKAGDTLVVAKLDRFARSVSQASDLITKLIDEGIRVDVCNLGILDNSSMSTLMRNILLINVNTKMYKSSKIIMYNFS